MFSSVVAASLMGFSCLTAVTAVPFTYSDNPLGNGFPNPNPAELQTIEQAGHGTLPIAYDNAPPHTLSAESITSFKVIALQELMEVGYYTQLINNITLNIPGYIFTDEEGDTREYILTALGVIQAQEQMHLLNANGALQKSIGATIQPCVYDFPVDDIMSAIKLAAKMTDVVVGSLQDVIVAMGTNGDAGNTRGVASVVGQEAMQAGLFRNLLGQSAPSAMPFLTASTGRFAFSALIQNFVVEGSCPNFTDVGIPLLNTLNVLTETILPAAQLLDFSIPLTASTPNYDWYNMNLSLQLVLLNQQNKPIIEVFKNINVTPTEVTFSAFFPWDGSMLNTGFTIAAITPIINNFTDIDSVSNAAIWGPGLIEVLEPVNTN